MRLVLIRRSSCWIFSQRSLSMRWASASCSVDNMRWCFTTKMNIICLVQHTTTEMIDWVKIYCIQQFTKQFTSLRNKTAVSERPRTVVPVWLPAAGVDTQQHRRSTNRQLLAVPRYRLNTYGRRAFSVASSTVWNSLPDFIRHPTISADCFRRLFKTYLFARY